MLKDLNIKIFIPARMSSTRLPGKPLLDIHGSPMILRVANTCAEVIGKENVHILTPDTSIYNVCVENKFPAIITSHKCTNGTERLAEVVKQFECERYINVQGDEPLLRPHIIEDFIINSRKLPGSAIGYTTLIDQTLVESESVVKIVLSDNRVIYASRLPIAIQDIRGKIQHKKHVGIYSFTREDLVFFGNSNVGPIEAHENIEIMRLIENGKHVFATEVSTFGRSVDTYDDYLFVTKYGNFNE